MSEEKKTKKYYKKKTANWRKRFLYDYLGGELGKEVKMVQYTHTLLEDILFDLGQQGRGLSYHSAVTKYKLNKKHLHRLMELGFVYTSKDKFNGEDFWLYTNNIQTNLAEIDVKGKAGFLKQANRKDRQHIEYVVEDDEKDDEKDLPF